MVRELQRGFVMTERHELRWGGFAGLGFVVLGLVAAFLPGLAPRITESNSDISAYVADGKNLILVGALCWAVAAGLVIWFSTAFAEAIRERDDRSDVHTTVLAGTVFVASAVFMSAAGTATMAYGIGTRDVALTVTLFKGLMVLQAMTGLAAALPLTAAGVGVLRTRLMPDWVGYVGIAAAVISAVSSLGIFVTSGTFVPGGPILALTSLVAAGIFILCASFYMVREHLPEVTPMAIPQA